MLFHHPEPDPVPVPVPELGRSADIGRTPGEDGHLTGDLLLRSLSDLLRRSFRTEDYVCRYGGDEFVVVMPSSSSADAAGRAEHLRQRIGALEISSDDGPQTTEPITVSIGVASLNATITDAESLLRTADQALYQAKLEGRNRVVEG